MGVRDCTATEGLLSGGASNGEDVIHMIAIEWLLASIPPSHQGESVVSYFDGIHCPLGSTWAREAQADLAVAMGISFGQQQ